MIINKSPFRSWMLHANIRQTRGVKRTLIKSFELVMAEGYDEEGMETIRRRLEVKQGNARKGQILTSRSKC